MSQTEVQLIKADAVQTADIANSAVTDAKISALTSSKLTGALPAISGASLTNLPASGKAHNLIINGAMTVAQRGTSSTAAGYKTVDRFVFSWSGTDESPTQAQADVASGTTPYSLGFRKSYKVTNGNQTGGAGAADYVRFYQVIESQDIANSGWNYVSSSSNITLSFWIKSSVAQNFYGYFLTQDGSAQMYPYETGSLSADTWTKVTKTIPGNSNLQFDNDANQGFYFFLWPFAGTDFTNNSATNDAWTAYSGSARMKDATSTWYTTNDATLEITGVQLEVGDSATDFEHLSFSDNLRKCHRYFQKLLIYEYTGVSSNNYMFVKSFNYHGGEMRATPSITGSRYTDGSGNFIINNSGTQSTGVTLYNANNKYIAVYGGNGSTCSTIRGEIDVSAEL